MRRWGLMAGQAAIIADAKCKDPCDGALVACDLTLCLPLLKEREDASGRVVGRRNMLGFEEKNGSVQIGRRYDDSEPLCPEERAGSAV